MGIGINGLDDDDFGMGFTPQEPPQQQQYENQELPKGSETEDEFLSDFLKTRGIDDISKINFEDENGNIEEKSWDSLTKEEKFNILNTPFNISENNYQQAENNNELTEEEIDFINHIRQNNLTPEQFIHQI